MSDNTPPPQVWPTLRARDARALIHFLVDAFGFEETVVYGDGDVVHQFGPVGVVTDKMSLPYLAGATVDFVDTIEKQGFTIDNPNAGGSCACGDSFH